MKPINHIKFSFIWLTIVVLILNLKVSILDCSMLLLGAIIPDFDLLDYIILFSFNLITKNCKIYKTIADDKYLLLRKSILFLLINILGIIVGVYINNLFIILPFTYISIFIFLKHRHFSHSLTSLIGLTLIFLMISSISISYSFFKFFILGYLMHLVQDMCTYHGIPLLYPNKKQYSFLRKKRNKQINTDIINKNIMILSIITMSFAMLIGLLNYI